MNRSFSLAAILLSASAASAAAPSITALSGTAANDQTVTITGTGFGTDNLRQTWFGGTTGFVDSRADGTRIDQMSIPGLSLLQPSTATYPHVSTERSWSNGHSIAFDVRNTTEYKQTLFLDTGSSGYNYLYTNALIYFTHDNLASGSYLQWKMMRWTRTATVVDGDGGYMANRPNALAFFTNFNSNGQTTFWFNAAGTRDLPGRGAWYRYETWTQLNSSPGTANGQFRVRVTNPTTGAVVVDNNFTNVMYNGPSNSGNFRYYVLQNYFGNAGDSGSGQPDNANAAAWWDDIYVSQSQARVEICTSPTYSGCTSREIQPASSWADGSVTVKLNKGNMATMGSTYLYVTNSRGETNSQGFPVVAGTAPNPPSSVSVQ